MSRVNNAFEDFVNSEKGESEIGAIDATSSQEHAETSYSSSEAEDPKLEALIDEIQSNAPVLRSWLQEAFGPNYSNGSLTPGYFEKEEDGVYQRKYYIDITTNFSEGVTSSWQVEWDASNKEMWQAIYLAVVDEHSNLLIPSQDLNLTSSSENGSDVEEPVFSLEKNSTLAKQPVKIRKSWQEMGLRISRRELSTIISGKMTLFHRSYLLNNEEDPQDNEATASKLELQCDSDVVFQSDNDASLLSTESAISMTTDPQDQPYEDLGNRTTIVSESESSSIAVSQINNEPSELSGEAVKNIVGFKSSSSSLRAIQSMLLSEEDFKKRIKNSNGFRPEDCEDCQVDVEISKEENGPYKIMARLKVKGKDGTSCLTTPRELSTETALKVSSCLFSINRGLLISAIPEDNGLNRNNDTPVLIPPPISLNQKMESNKKRLDNDFKSAIRANNPLKALELAQALQAYDNFQVTVRQLLNDLEKAVKKNPDNEYANLQVENVTNLVESITSESNTSTKNQAIQTFKEASENCLNKHSGRFKKHSKLVTAVITAACAVVGFLAGAILGAFIGGVLGAPTGPGAAITAAVGAVVAGAKGAVIGAAAGAAFVGAGGFAVSNYGFFKTKQLTDQTVKEATSYIRQQDVANNVPSESSNWIYAR